LPAFPASLHLLDNFSLCVLQIYPDFGAIVYANSFISALSPNSIRLIRSLVGAC
jgi:hypothetical protein